MVEDYIGTEGEPYESYASFVKTMVRYVNPRINKPDNADCLKAQENAKELELVLSRVMDLEQKDKAKDEKQMSTPSKPKI